jgi:hypothetical protein
MFNTLKTVFCIIYKTVCTSHKKHFSATKTDQFILFRERVAVFFVKTIRNTKRHSVRRMQNFSVLKQVVHIEPLDFEWLINISGKPTESGPPNWKFGHETKKPTSKIPICCSLQ